MSLKNFIIPKLLPIGSALNCADNSGAKKLRIIGYKYYQGTTKRRLTGGIGSIAKVVVTQGKESLKNTVHNAVIIRQKYPITRFIDTKTLKVKFEDNAAVLLEPDFKVKKATVKGVIAREIFEMKNNYENLNGAVR